MLENVDRRMWVVGIRVSKERKVVFLWIGWLKFWKIIFFFFEGDELVGLVGVLIFNWGLRNEKEK